MGAGAAFLRILLLLLGLVALTSLRIAFRRAGVRNGANPLRVTMLPHRGVALALLAARLVALGGFAGVADLAMLGFAACALYLGACATRPPEHRRRRWLATSGSRYRYELSRARMQRSGGPGGRAAGIGIRAALDRVQLTGAGAAL